CRSHVFSFYLLDLWLTHSLLEPRLNNLHAAEARVPRMADAAWEMCVCVCACVHSEQSYLCEPERWASACVEPQRVVLWNASLFTVLIVTSGIQAILCT